MADGADSGAIRPGASLARESRAGGLRLILSGSWDIHAVERFEDAFHALEAGPGVRVEFDLAQVRRLDSAGAWLLHRTAKRLRAAGATVELAGAGAAQTAMLALMGELDLPGAPAPAPLHPVLAFLERVGRGAAEILNECWHMLGFLGLVAARFLRLALRPWRLRVAATVRQLEYAGLNAIPIVALISFLIGVVISYQGAFQLRRFGAEVFAVDLLAISVLREIGILLTAVVVAGRSGSAFTAEIGTMKISEEIDAMRTLGLDPVEVLVLPRVIALVIALPLLGFLADIMGLFGGAVMLHAELGLSAREFMTRFESAFAPWSFGVGLLKAPFFAFIIAVTGCHMGFRVRGSAESVGRRTTLSVVYAIFLVIVADALFSVFFSFVGI